MNFLSYLICWVFYDYRIVNFSLYFYQICFCIACWWLIFTANCWNPGCSFKAFNSICLVNITIPDFLLFTIYLTVASMLGINLKNSVQLDFLIPSEFCDSYCIWTYFVYLFCTVFVFLSPFYCSEHLLFLY